LNDPLIGASQDIIQRHVYRSSLSRDLDEAAQLVADLRGRVRDLRAEKDLFGKYLENTIKSVFEARVPTASKRCAFAVWQSVCSTRF